MTTMVKDFLKFAKKQKIDTANIYTESNKEYSLASFTYGINLNQLFTITLIFYEKNNSPSEIIISKPISENDILTSLIRANELNVNYMNTTFYINDATNTINVKTFVISYEDINIPINKMFELIDIANQEFPEFI